MKKEQARRWLQQWLKHQQQVTKASVLGLAGLAAGAWLLELGLTTVIAYVGFLRSWGLALLVSGGVLGLVQWLTLRRISEHLGDRQASGTEQNAEAAEYRLAQPLSAVWMYAFGSMDTDLSWQEKLVAVLCMPQRLTAAAVFTKQRMQELRQLNTDICAAVIRHLYREAERVEISELASELQLRNPVAAIREVSLIDGVLLLTRRNAGLSLAGRLAENIAEWLQGDAVSGDTVAGRS